jgi:hypothetical protein
MVIFVFEIREKIVVQCVNKSVEWRLTQSARDVGIQMDGKLPLKLRKVIGTLLTKGTVANDVACEFFGPKFAAFCATAKRRLPLHLERLGMAGCITIA